MPTTITQHLRRIQGDRRRGEAAIHWVVENEDAQPTRAERHGMMHRRMIDAGERSRKHLGTMPRKLKNIRSREIKEQYDEIRASLAARGIEPKLPEVHPETENA